MKNRIATIISLGLLMLGQCFAAEIPRVLNYQGRVASGGVVFQGVGQFKFALRAPQGGGAIASGTITDGFLTSITLASGGAGYIVAPLIKVSGGGGAGATGTATISGGVVTAITVNTPGSGYSSAPEISFTAAEGDYAAVWSNDGTVGDEEPSLPVALTVTKGVFTARLGDTAFPNMMMIPDTAFQKAPRKLRVWFNDGVKGFQALLPDTNISSTDVRVKNYSNRPFNFFGSSTGLNYNPSLEGIPIMLPYTSSDNGYGRNSYTARQPVPQNATVILSISAPVMADSNGYAGVRLVAYSANANRIVIQESTLNQVGGTVIIKPNATLDKGNFQYFIEVFAGSYWNNGYRSGSATVRSCTISYDGSDIE